MTRGAPRSFALPMTLQCSTCLLRRAPHSTQRRKRIAAESSVRDGGTVGRTPDVRPRTSATLSDALSTLSSRAKSRDLLSAGTDLPCARPQAAYLAPKQIFRLRERTRKRVVPSAQDDIIGLKVPNPRHASREVRGPKLRSEVRRPLFAGGCRPLAGQLDVVAQGDIHEHAASAVSQHMTSASVSSLLVGPCSEVCRTGGCTRKWKP